MESCGFRILFAGNPDIAVPALTALADHFTVVGVLTNPDRPSGRGRHLESPPVKVEAQRLGIPVLQFEKVRREAREAVAALEPNILISFASGHYFGPKFLSLFDHGGINIHPSLLPRYRGSSPIQFALLHGDRTTGITVQRIVAEIDSGDILASVTIPLDGDETTESLNLSVAGQSATLIVQTLDDLCGGKIVERSQQEEDATFSRLLTKEDGHIDWNRSAREIHCMVRAYQPWPRAYTTFKDKTLFITGVYGSHFDVPFAERDRTVAPGTVLGMVKKRGLAIACSDGILYVDRLQLAQKKEMDSAAFTNGNPTIIGAVLGAAHDS